MNISSFKRLSLVLVTCMVFGLVLNACGGGANNKPAESTTGNESTTATESAEATEKPKSDVTLTISSSQGWVKDIDREIAKKFEAETGIKVDFQVAPDDKYTDLVKTKLATADSTDIVIYAGGIQGLTELQVDKNFIPLDDEPWIKSLIPQAPQVIEYNGKKYGLPRWGYDGWNMIYNKKQFTDLGIKAPVGYQEFVAASEALIAKGIVPFYLPGKEVWNMQVMFSASQPSMQKKDPTMVDKLNKNELKYIDIPEMKLGLTQIKEAADKGYFGKDFMSNTWDGRFDAFKDGKYAMVMCYMAYINELDEKFPDKKGQWGILPLPFSDNKDLHYGFGGPINMISAKSKHIEEAKQYFMFITKKENLDAYYQARPDFAAPYFVGVDSKTPEDMKKGLESNSFVEQKDPTIFDGNVIGKGIQDILVGGAKAEDVLKAEDASRAKTGKATGLEVWK